MAVRPEPQLKTFNDMPFDGPAHNLVADVRPSQDSSCLPARELPPLDARHGIDLLVEEYLKSDGDIQLVTIGALTNVAMALIKEPRLKFKIPRIVAMAGRSVEPPILFTGGVARISGMETALEAALGRPVAVSPEPQMTGALGAALLARRHCENMNV